MNAVAEEYVNKCQDSRADCVLEVLSALNHGAKECMLCHRAFPLRDVDLECLAEPLRHNHTLRTLVLEGNAFGSVGVRALLNAASANNGALRELRLPKNHLDDSVAEVVAHCIAVPTGLKVLDLSDNLITRVGVASLCRSLLSADCDVVELSLHSNEIDADGALSLTQALCGGAKLRHLHLGYNSLSDEGAAHFARALPRASSLLTLDLTANAIGPKGGEDLAKALSADPPPHLQRLTLRHNRLDDAAMRLFADVIVRNSSLTHLSLGFMPPSPPTASMVLASLRHGKSLLYIDLLGWAFREDGAQALINDILTHNRLLCAIVTDHSAAVSAHAVDVLNTERATRGMDPVYVGPDDKAAATMTVAISRKKASRAPTTSPTRSASHVQDNRQINQVAPTAVRNTPPPSGEKDQDIDTLMLELQRAPCDPELRNRLLMVLSQLQLKMEIQRSYQQQQIVALEERVRVLEQRDLGRRVTTNEGELPRRPAQIEDKAASQSLQRSNGIRDDKRAPARPTSPRQGNARNDPTPVRNRSPNLQMRSVSPTAMEQRRNNNNGNGRSGQRDTSPTSRANERNDASRTFVSMGAPAQPPVGAEATRLPSSEPRDSKPEPTGRGNSADRATPPAPLFVPTAVSTAEVKRPTDTHSPVPDVDPAAPAPDLQHSRHEPSVPSTCMVGPQKSDRPPRPGQRQRSLSTQP